MFSIINNFLDGKKSIIGMIGATATFVAAIVAIVADGVVVEDFALMGAAFSAWSVVMGFGHKLKKIEAFLKK